MGYEFNHVHLKAPDPRKTAEWYAEAFDFTIVSDIVRPYGDQFRRDQDSRRGDGQHPRGREPASPWATATPTFTGDWSTSGSPLTTLDAELERLTAMGAELKEGPIDVPERPKKLRSSRARTTHGSSCSSFPDNTTTPVQGRSFAQEFRSDKRSSHAKTIILSESRQ